MKIQCIIENEIQPSKLPFNAMWYHCGPEFDQFSTAFLGGGENNHLLGLGMYFINSPEIAKRYAKYVKRGDAVLYEATFNAHSEDFYCSRNKPDSFQDRELNKIAKLLGFEHYRDIPYRHSIMKYGRGVPGVVFEKFGAQKGAQILIEHGIHGQFEDVGDGVFEIAVWDTNIIKIVNKTKLPRDPNRPPDPEPDPELDAWWEEMMNDKKPS